MEVRSPPCSPGMRHFIGNVGQTDFHEGFCRDSCAPWSQSRARQAQIAARSLHPPFRPTQLISLLRKSATGQTKSKAAGRTPNHSLGPGVHP